MRKRKKFLWVASSCLRSPAVLAFGGLLPLHLRPSAVALLRLARDLGLTGAVRHLLTLPALRSPAGLAAHVLVIPLRTSLLLLLLGPVAVALSSVRHPCALALVLPRPTERALVEVESFPS